MAEVTVPERYRVVVRHAISALPSILYLQILILNNGQLDGPPQNLAYSETLKGGMLM
jgi:hypothetical protein